MLKTAQRTHDVEENYFEYTKHFIVHVSGPHFRVNDTRLCGNSRGRCFCRVYPEHLVFIRPRAEMPTFLCKLVLVLRRARREHMTLFQSSYEASHCNASFHYLYRLVICAPATVISTTGWPPGTVSQPFRPDSN